ncbi:hypothetical protein HDV05_008215 [Chytridiales sp. JEL 0842]|nr:hypothetical protein HDV05_008215 [Chytridiales sp. JEL 0842]
MSAERSVRKAAADCKLSLSYLLDKDSIDTSPLDVPSSSTSAGDARNLKKGKTPRSQTPSPKKKIDFKQSRTISTVGSIDLNMLPTSDNVRSSSPSPLGSASDVLKPRKTSKKQHPSPKKKMEAQQESCTTTGSPFATAILPSPLVPSSGLIEDSLIHPFQAVLPPSTSAPESAPLGEETQNSKKSETHKQQNPSLKKKKVHPISPSHSTDAASSPSTSAPSSTQSDEKTETSRKRRQQIPSAKKKIKVAHNTDSTVPMDIDTDTISATASSYITGPSSTPSPLPAPIENQKASSKKKNKSPTHQNPPSQKKFKVKQTPTPTPSTTVDAIPRLQSVNETRWECPKCTFHNSVQIRTCEVCNCSKPSNYRIKLVTVSIAPKNDLNSTNHRKDVVENDAAELTKESTNTAENVVIGVAKSAESAKNAASVTAKIAIATVSESTESVKETTDTTLISAEPARVTTGIVSKSAESAKDTTATVSESFESAEDSLAITSESMQLEYDSIAAVSASAESAEPKDTTTTVTESPSNTTATAPNTSLISDSAEPPQNPHIGNTRQNIISPQALTMIPLAAEEYKTTFPHLELTESRPATLTKPKVARIAGTASKDSQSDASASRSVKKRTVTPYSRSSARKPSATSPPANTVPALSMVSAPPSRKKSNPSTSPSRRKPKSPSRNAPQKPQAQISVASSPADNTPHVLGKIEWGSAAAKETCFIAASPAVNNPVFFGFSPNICQSFAKPRSAPVIANDEPLTFDKESDEAQTPSVLVEVKSGVQGLSRLEMKMIDERIKEHLERMNEEGEILE